MRSFRVFAHSVETAEAVKVGFSWPAMLITLPWMLDKGLWTLAALWFGMESALALMVVLIPGGEERGAMAVLALVVVLALKIYAGASGNRWRDEHLRQHRYNYVTTVRAGSPEDAVEQARNAARS